MAMATVASRTATDTDTATASGRPRGLGADAGARDEPLDTTVRLVTPERIVFQYPLAGPFRRLCAYLVDLGVLALLLIAAQLLSTVLTLGAPGGTGLFLVAFFVLVWGYGSTCEGLFNGQTLGKRLMGIRVVSDRGVPITGAQAVIRNLVGVVDGFAPFMYMPGLVCMFLTRRFQRLGDLAAGTMVVVEQRRKRARLVRVEGKEVEAVLPWLPLRVAAGPELSRALSEYVRSRDRFNAALREEMAGPLARPLRRRHGLPDGPSDDAVLCAVYHRVFLGE
jgi:uncharacterized RDD family membrane protein YckC